MDHMFKHCRLYLFLIISLGTFYGIDYPHSALFINICYHPPVGLNVPDCEDKDALRLMGGLINFNPKMKYNVYYIRIFSGIYYSILIFSFLFIMNIDYILLI